MNGDIYPSSNGIVDIGTPNVRFNSGNFVQVTTTERVVVNSGRVILESDSEGGNIRWMAADGTTWEIDSLAGDCRIFTYANGVKTGIVISKMGEVGFPEGFTNTNTILMRGSTLDAPGKEGLCPAPDAGYPDRFLKADGTWGHTGGDSSESSYYIGYGVSLYGTAKSVKISNTTYLIFAQARADGKNGEIPETFLWGFNLTTMLANLGIFGKVKYRWGKYMVYDSSHMPISGESVVGFGTGFTQKHTDDGENGYEIITPGRYYTSEGGFGDRSSNSVIAETGNFWDCVFLVDVF